MIQEVRKEMINVDQYQYIRYLYEREGLSQRAIAKKLKISRNTVKKYCKGEHMPWQPQKRHYSSPVTDPVRPIVEKWLTEDESAPEKQRHTARRIYHRLVEEYGFKGGESTIRQLVRAIKNSKKEAYIPLEFDYGEAMQVDWGQAVFKINGKEVKAHLFCARLCASCAPFVIAYPMERKEAFLDGHIKAFEFFGGVPKRLIYDNLKTAVKEGWGKYVSDEQMDFKALKAHYAFESTYCNRGQGHEKGLVEGLVGFIRRNVLVPIPEVETWEELNQKLIEKCINYRDHHHIQYRKETVKEAFLEEQKALAPLPVTPYDPAVKSQVKVNSDGLIHFDTNRYSVPLDFAGYEVTVNATPFEIIVYSKNKKIANHERAYGRNETRYKIEHYLDELEKRPRAIKNAKPLRHGGIPDDILNYKDKITGSDSDIQFVKLLKLLIQYGYEEVSKAIKKAAEEGQYNVEIVRFYINKDTTDVKAIPPITDKDEIKIETSNLAEYDNLIWSEAI